MMLTASIGFLLSTTRQEWQGAASHTDWADYTGIRRSDLREMKTRNPLEMRNRWQGGAEFAAGFYSGLLLDRPEEEAVRWSGVHRARLNFFLGDKNMMTLTQVRRFLAIQAQSAGYPRIRVRKVSKKDVLLGTTKGTANPFRLTQEADFFVASLLVNQVKQME
jgi:hypothetical protein